MKLKFGRSLYLLAAVSALIGIMLFCAYLLPQNVFFSTVASLINLIFIFFLSGYILSCLIFGKADVNETANIGEMLIFSIGFSICITILTGMIAHFVQMRINLVNIMLGVLVLSIVLSVYAVFAAYGRRVSLRASSRRRKEAGRRREGVRTNYLKNNRIFLFCSVLLLFVIAVIIYMSISMPSEEEFVELYWKVSELAELKKELDVNCAIDDCNLSVIYELGRVNLLDDYYDAIITDFKAGVGYGSGYDSICIDFNKNGIHCETSEGEGPFGKGDTFGIGSNFNSNLFSVVLSNEKFYIFNFPKNTAASNFSVGFSMKSYYKETRTFNVALFVNETMQYSENVAMEPQQEVSKNYQVRLPDAGVYKVRIAVLPLTVEDRAYIEFWVEKEVGNGVGTV